MTVIATVNDRVTGPLAATSGQTVFDSDFPVVRSADVTVVRTRAGVVATLLPGTAYTVSLLGRQEGCRITLTAGSTAGDLVTIVGLAPIERLSNYADNGQIRDDDLNDELVRLVFQQQEIRRDQSGTLSVGQYDPDGPFRASGRGVADVDYLDLSESDAGSPLAGAVRLVARASGASTALVLRLSNGTEIDLGVASQGFAGQAAGSAAAASASAASASGSASAAATSATAAGASATDADADRVQTGLDRTATAADRVQTGLDRTAAAGSATAAAADRVQTGLDRTAAGGSATSTAADRVQTGLDRTATAADRVQTGLDRTATAADRVQTGLDRTAAAGSATAAATSATAAAGSATAAASSAAQSIGAYAAYAGTSATSVPVAIANGVAFATQAGKSWVAGMPVTFTSAANAANSLTGLVTGYSGTSLVANITATRGSGTAADWLISVPVGTVVGPDAVDVQAIDPAATSQPVIVDAAGRVLLSLDAAAGLVAAGFTGSVNASALTLAGTSTEEVYGIAFAVIHSNDRVAFYVLDDGTAAVPGATVTPVRYAVDGITSTDRAVNQAVDWNIHLGSGQSLAAAANDGTITYAAGDLQSHAGAGSIIALTNQGQYGVGLVAMEQVKFALKGDAGRNVLVSPGYADDYTALYSSNAFSGVQLFQMLPGASPDRFAAHMAAIDNIVTAAAAVGKTTQVPFLLWQQGESDPNTTSYKADLVGLKNTYNTQALTRTKQPNRFPVIYTQLAGSNNGNIAFGALGLPIVGRAQWEAFREDPELILACPQYFLPYFDALHLTVTGYKWLGQMVGKVAYLSAVMGRSWKPLHPLSAKARTGNVVTLKLSVPSGNVVIDTATIPAATQMGFRVFDGAGEPSITTVAVVNGDTVRLVLSRALSGAATVEYAWRDHPVDGGSGNYAGTGVHAIRGNIRDSDASKSAYGDTYPLWNWLVRFQMAITA